MSLPNSASQYDEWLEANQSLRMDANNPLFKDSRRRFHLSRYEFAREYADNLRVLDAACGTGYGASLLAETASRVDGVDISGEAIYWAKSNYGNPATEFHTACVEFTPFGESTFDMVVSFETLEHTLSPATALWEFVRVLKPDGTAILSVPNAWGLTENHFVDFDKTLFETFLGRCFGEFRLFYNNSGNRSSKVAGIGPLETLAEGTAECLIAVCTKLRKNELPQDLHSFWTNEVYENSFERHREFLELRSSIPKFLRRFIA